MVIKITKVVSKLDIKEVTPEMKLAIQKAQASFAKQVENDLIWGAFGVPKSIIDTGKLSSNVSTASGSAEFNLSKEDLDCAIQYILRYTQLRDMKETILDNIKRTGLDSDNVDRCRIALRELNGMDNLMKIPLNELTIESTIEVLLQVYRGELSEF